MGYDKTTEALKAALTALRTLADRLELLTEYDEAQGACDLIEDEKLWPLAQIREALAAAGVPQAEIASL